jgi:hypothetical protein
MNLLPPTRITIIFGLCMAGLAAALSFEHMRISAVIDGFSKPAGLDSIDTIDSKLTSLNAKLLELDSRRTLSNEDHSTAQLSISNRLNAVEISAVATADSVLKLSSAQLSSEELVMLRATVEALDIRLSDLQRTQNLPPNALAPTGDSSRAKAAHRPKAANAPPPFTAIAIESRGSQQFLSVATIGSTQLHQINLIRLGDTVPGTSWVLRSLDAKAAQFEVAGVHRTIPLAL